MNLKILEGYLPINLLGPSPRLIKKRIYRAAVSQKLRNTGLEDSYRMRVCIIVRDLETSKLMWSRADFGYGTTEKKYSSINEVLP